MSTLFMASLIGFICILSYGWYVTFRSMNDLTIFEEEDAELLLQDFSNGLRNTR